MDDVDDFEKEANDFEVFLVETGYDSLSETSLTEDNRSELKKGLDSLESGCRGIRTILDGIRRAGGATRATTAEFGFNCLWRVMEGAYYIGSVGTVTDSHKNFLVRKPGSDGGKKGSATRLMKADEKWRNHAFDLASSIRGDNKTLSQQRLATEIACRWALEEEPCRESMLVGLIREWEQQGRLPRRQTE